MVSDTLQIAICGDMPDMTGRLACREANTGTLGIGLNRIYQYNKRGSEQ